MKKFVIPALIIAAPQLVATFFSMTYYENRNLSFIIGLIYLVITFFLFLHFTKKYKANELKNEMSFSKGFGYSMKVSVLWAVFCCIINFIYSKVNYEAATALNEKLFNEQRKKIIEQMGSISLSEENKLKELIEIQQNPLFMAGGTFIYLIFVGLFISLIVAGITKTKIKEQ